MMMKKLLPVLLCLLMAFSCAMAEDTLVLTDVTQEGVNARVSYPIAAGSTDDEALNQLIQSVGQTELRLAVLGAMDESGAGITSLYTAAQAGECLSIAFSTKGQLAMGNVGQEYAALCVDLRTGEKVTLADLFIDADAAVSYMEEMLTENQGGQLSGYLEANEFTPLPQESFYVDETGITFYYGPRQVLLLSGYCGKYRFYWYELQEYLNLGEDGILSTFLNAESFLPGGREGLEAVAQQGALPGIEITLGQNVEDAIERYRELCDPDYTPDGMYYYLEDGWTDGLRVVTGREDSQVAGLLLLRGSVNGLEIGLTTGDEIKAALGPADAEEALAGATAMDYQMEAGTLMHYDFGERQFSFYLSEDGVLYAILLKAKL